MSLFQSNLRKQIRNLPKILNFVKKIHYYSELFTSLLRSGARARASPPARAAPAPARLRPPRPAAMLAAIEAAIEADVSAGDVKRATLALTAGQSLKMIS